MDKKIIKSFLRLKQKPNDVIESSATLKSAPYVIEFVNNEEKMNILKAARNLRKMEDYTGVYINNDLNKSDRELLKEKIMERNAKI
jgi:hypothetical protein